MIKTHLRRYSAAIILGLSLLATAPVLLAAAPALAQPHFSEQDLLDLRQVNDYLNGLGFLQGRFLQVSNSGGGAAEGNFYMAERTRLRFEYDDPVPLTFISNGTFVGIDNREMETVSQFPIASTPLRVLLRRNVDLTADANITAVERIPGQLRVTATEDSGVAQGELTLVFTYPSLELRQWIVVDAQGFRTTVALTNIVEVDSLPRELFRFPRYELSDVFD